jgi:outer membrane protein
MMDRSGIIGGILLTLLLFEGLPAEETPVPAAPHPEESQLSSSPATPAGPDLTLPMAVDMALKQHPLIRASVAGREIADARLNQAQARRWPLLQFSETYTYSNNPVFVFGSLLEQSRFTAENFALESLNNPDPLSNFRTAVTLRVPIFDQLKSGSQIDQAQIRQGQADRHKEAVRQQIRFEVIHSFFGVLVAQARKNVADEAVKTAEADVQRIQNLFAQGIVVQSDLLAAQVQLSEFNQQQVQAAGDLAVANSALNITLGLPVEKEPTLRGQLDEKKFEVPGIDSLIAQAMAHRPDYAGRKAAVLSAEKGIRGAHGQYLPRVDFFSTYGISGENLTSGSSDYAVGAGLTYNFFDSSRKAQLDEARAARSLAVAEQEQLANQIHLEVVKAFQQYLSARNRLHLAAQTVHQAQETLRIVRDRYQEGLTIITEVLRAQTALVRSRIHLLAARYDHYIGYALVLKATGQLGNVQPFWP